MLYDAQNWDEAADYCASCDEYTEALAAYRGAVAARGGEDNDCQPY